MSDTKEAAPEVSEQAQPETAAKIVQEAEEKPYKVPDSKYFPQFEEKLPAQDGKVVLITGTTSGTGYIAARTSLKKGATTVILNRDSSRAEKAVEKLKAVVPDAGERLIWIKCDLQDFESVKKAAEEVKQKFPDGVHVLCNNAGVMALADKATKDGYDVQMQTNHLSHFLLTKELFPLLVKASEKSGDARVINHSSGARLGLSPLKAKYFGKNGGKLGGNGNSMMTGARWERYHQTKLANSVFTVELAKRSAKAGLKVRAFCAHPGLAATELQATTSKDDGLKNTGFMSSAQSPEDGTMGILRGMFDPEVKNGALYGPAWMTGPAKQIGHGMLTTSHAGKLLWRESEKACGEFKVEKPLEA